MLSEKIMDTASELITLAFEEQDKHLSQEHGRLVADFARRNVLGSRVRTQLGDSLLSSDVIQDILGKGGLVCRTFIG